MNFNVKAESIYISIKIITWNVNRNRLKTVCQKLLCSMNANVTYYHSNFWDDEHHHYYFSFLLSKFNKSVAHHKSLNINNRWNIKRNRIRQIVSTLIPFIYFASHYTFLSTRIDFTVLAYVVERNQEK